MVIAASFFMMISPLIVQAAGPAVPSVTLAETKGMSPDALALRLLPDRQHGPMVDAIINGRGLTPPSASVNRVWLVEQMVPFDADVCRSHVFEIEMGSSDPAAKPYAQALPTHPIEIAEYDRLWVPPSGAANVSACAAAPAQASGFHDGGLGLRQAAALVVQARAAFKAAGRLKIRCRGERGACGLDPRKTLRAIDWSSLGSVEQVDRKGETYSFGDPKPADAAWGPAHVQFTFPYAAKGATWVITVDRRPHIDAIRMQAETIVYE